VRSCLLEGHKDRFIEHEHDECGESESATGDRVGTETNRGDARRCL
jgi:hypothetical protein